MFYCTELLCLRNRGKLARCWLAATLTEQRFRRLVKRITLESIEIPALCDEILTTVQNRGNVENVKFSLYLSSQLMYGTAKILYYQTNLLQEDLLIRMSQRKIRRDEKYNLALTLREPEIPLSQIFIDRAAAPDLNLITDDAFVFEHMVQDELNFGILTNDEMDRFLFSHTEGQFLNEIRTCRWSQARETIEHTVEVPPIDLNNLDVETIKIRRETLNKDVGDISFKMPETPTKRTRKSLPQTPTKKRKISVGEMQTRHLVDVDMPLLAHGEVPSPIMEGPVAPESVVEPTEVSVPGPVVRKEFPNRQVHIVEEEELMLKSRRGRRIFVDNETTLSDVEMQKWIRNVKAHTKERRPHNIHHHSAEYYLQQPCAKITHRSLGELLTKLLSQHMITRSVTNNEFPHIDIDFSLPFLRHDETIRADAVSGIHGQTVDMSSKIAVSATEISIHSKTLHPIPSIEVLPTKFSGEQIETSTKQIDETFATPPEIIEFEKIIEETTELSQKSPRRHKGTPKSSSSSAKATITKTELRTLVQVHWHDSPFSKFHRIIPPDTYSKRDAAHAFLCFLELHSEKRVVLKQATPYDTIWIEKPIESSEESSAETP